MNFGSQITALGSLGTFLEKIGYYADKEAISHCLMSSSWKLRNYTCLFEDSENFQVNTLCFRAFNDIENIFKV